RDRQLFSEILAETQPLEDVFSFFASFYLHSYQGIRLVSATDSPEHTPEEGKDQLGKELSISCASHMRCQCFTE
ncbi:unnamed protein product, partial [marine sediment metagenome]